MFEPPEEHDDQQRQEERATAHLHDERAYLLVQQRGYVEDARRVCVDLVYGLLREGDDGEHDYLRDGQREQVHHLQRIVQPRQLRHHAADGPPHQHRRPDEDEVLDDVQPVVRHGGVVQRRHVEEGEGDVEQRERQDGMGREPHRPEHQVGP